MKYLTQHEFNIAVFDLCRKMKQTKEDRDQMEKVLSADDATPSAISLKSSNGQINYVWFRNVNESTDQQTTSSL